LSTAVVTVAAASAFPACAHDDTTLFVAGVLQPPQSSSAGGQCIYTVTTSAPMIGRGLVDASIAKSYTPVFLMGSQMKAQVNPDSVRAESSNTTIQGAIVRVVDPTSGAVTMSNTVLASGLIYAAQGTSPSYLAMGTTIMDLPSIQHFDPGAANPPNPSRLAVVYVKFFGQTGGHQSIESDEFQYPVDVCNGCLVVIPAGDVATQDAYCSGKVALKSSSTPCVIGQDQYVDCQLCYNQAASCHP
jgi:hypothetical protein